MNTPLRVIALDHIVLKCADISTTLAWYVEVLGLHPVRVDEWQRGEAPFPSARVNDHTIIDFVRSPENVPDDSRLDHFCLVVEPVDLAALAQTRRFDVVAGPATLYGARGNGKSLYVRDPDGTVVELRHY